MAEQEKEVDKNPTEKDENIEQKTESVPPTYDSQSSPFYTQFPPNNYRQNIPNRDLQYKNAREYAQVLHCWLWQYRMLAAFSTFQSQMISSVAQNATAANNARGPQVQLGNGHLPNGIPQTPVPEHHGPGVHYKVPMLWRRVVAEFLDFILLFYTKILVTVAVLRQMGYMNEDILDIDAQFPFLSDIGELDYDRVFSLTSELIALEVVNRLCITLVETMCLRQGFAGAIGGATPGKKIMQLRVVSFSEITNIRNGHILVVGASDPGFFNALIRSIIKNFSMAFFFPACLTVFFFRYNRAAYDILAQTVVVEVENRRPEQAN
ncbi:protein FAM8A1-like [Ruditapes philippinarum]|uniref:protein FAM8A1-like n=1 Tax=Ruditapes philippinarum TaxID=129788 RepID=UPI00295BADD6|nr:protein FAM8A1-like [Ruditapes philippinarum]